MGSNKKNNTAVKDEQDFVSEILAEELQGMLKAVPEHDAHDFFNELKDEMLEEGINLEKSVIQEFTKIDMIPEELKSDVQSEAAAKAEKSESSFSLEPIDDSLSSDEQIENLETPENLKDFITENKTEESPADLTDSVPQQDVVEAAGVETVNDVFEGPTSDQVEDVVEDGLSPQEVNAAVDEIFGEVESSSTDDGNTNPVRVFEDKTAAVKDFPDETALVHDDKTQDLSALEAVNSVESAQAQMFHQVAKRNPSIDLKNADYIKFAQGKIKDLEKDLANLRVETQELALAGSHFKALADEREQLNKSLEAKISEVQSTAQEEKKILNAALEAKETKISLLQERVENLEVELESKYNRLRVRERELESRLEILKQEQDAVSSSKDELILRVKKQNNALTADLERSRAQTQKNSSLLQEKEDALRRTIKALKLSLTMLESQKKK